MDTIEHVWPRKLVVSWFSSPLCHMCDNYSCAYVHIYACILLFACKWNQDCEQLVYVWIITYVPGLKSGQYHWPGWPTDPDMTRLHKRHLLKVAHFLVFTRTAMRDSEHFESSLSTHRIKHDSSPTMPTLKGTTRLTRFEIAAMLYFLFRILSPSITRFETSWAELGNTLPLSPEPDAIINACDTM